MKCIKAIKSSKKIEAGTIKRVDDVEAEARVRSTYWQYISKAEYKKVQPKIEAVTVNSNHEEDQKLIKVAADISMQTAMTISEKQLRRKKQK